MHGAIVPGISLGFTSGGGLFQAGCARPMSRSVTHVSIWSRHARRYRLRIRGFNPVFSSTVPGLRPVGMHPDRLPAIDPENAADRDAGSRNGGDRSKTAMPRVAARADWAWPCRGPYVRIPMAGAPSGLCPSPAIRLRFSARRPGCAPIGCCPGRRFHNWQSHFETGRSHGPAPAASIRAIAVLVSIGLKKRFSRCDWSV